MAQNLEQIIANYFPNLIKLYNPSPKSSSVRKILKSTRYTIIIWIMTYYYSNDEENLKNLQKVKNKQTRNNAHKEVRIKMITESLSKTIQEWW